MKFPLLVLLTALLSLANAPAQWVTRSYALKSGWNGIWMAGDASYTTVAELFAAYPNVTELWRWNPNPDQIEFSQTPSEPTTSSEEWTVWKRNDASEQLLTRMVANSSYLIRATADTALNLKELVTPPTATWLRLDASSSARSTCMMFPQGSRSTRVGPTRQPCAASLPTAGLRSSFANPST